MPASRYKPPPAMAASPFSVSPMAIIALSSSLPDLPSSRSRLRFPAPMLSTCNSSWRPRRRRSWSRRRRLPPRSNSRPPRSTSSAAISSRCSIPYRRATRSATCREPSSTRRPTWRPSSLFVRGGESNYNKVIIDGVPVNDPGGIFDFGVVPMDNVERVEMVRGPESTIYGSDAMTSTVQMWTSTGDTRTPEDPVWRGRRQLFNCQRLRVALRRARHLRLQPLRRRVHHPGTRHQRCLFQRACKAATSAFACLTM